MRKRIKYHLCGLFLGLAALSFWSCYPSGPSNIAETSIVVTLYDSNFNFGSVNTYALPEIVFDLPGSDTVIHTYDALILSEVDKNMTRLGYVKEVDPLQNGADVVVVVSVSRQTYAYVDYGWYPYWGYWPGWGYWGPWGPGWGFIYPWPPVETFSTGSVFIEMVDPNARDETNQKLPVRWSGVMNGLLSSSITVTAAQITAGINQCFAQSPYLGN